MCYGVRGCHGNFQVFRQTIPFLLMGKNLGKKNYTSMQVNQALPPPPDLGTNNSEPTGLSLVEQMKCKQLKPTQTKVGRPLCCTKKRQVTTLADLGYTDQDKLTDSKLGFREDEDPTEYFDEPGEFRKKALEVAELVKNAKRVVVFTGAGISTGNGANLPDYRGTEGVWTLHDKGLKPKKTLNSLESALPTVHFLFFHPSPPSVCPHGLGIPLKSWTR